MGCITSLLSAAQDLYDRHRLEKQEADKPQTRLNLPKTNPKITAYWGDQEAKANNGAACV